MSTTAENKCAVCKEPAPKRCQQCKSAFYCGRDHQISDWKSHKISCKAIAADQARADSYTIHKREFDRIRVKYALDNPEIANRIAELLANTDANEGVSAPEFAKMFGMTIEEAVVFLEWIKIGVKFKEDNIDKSKNAGFVNI